jgi:hypothetical protein
LALNLIYNSDIAIIKYFHLNDRMAIMKQMKGFRVPFDTKSAAPALSKIERSKSQL